MKIIHLSDFHLGKKVNEFSMIEDQRYIMQEILEIIDQVKPDAVIVAGDIYDKPVPPVEAVEIFDDFLYGMAQRGLPSFIISGNHDSAERISFASRLVSKSGIYLAPSFGGKISGIRLEDKNGPVNFYMLPFVKPAHVRRYYPDATIDSYTQAIQTVLGECTLHKDERNILIAHQFVTGATTSDSERISVGGSENVDAWVFDDFDYVALGHIHKPQRMTRDTIRYSGSPLKYSLSEINHVKSLTLVELGAKGSIEVSALPLKPKRDIVQIRGTYHELMAKSYYDKLNTVDYFEIILTDEEELFDVVNRLRKVYPNIMQITYDNTRTQTSGKLTIPTTMAKQDPLQLVKDFYVVQNGQALSDKQASYTKDLMEEIWEEKA